MLTREDDIDVHALHRQGWTISAIARHLGRDRKTIRAYLAGREAGVRARSSSQQPDPFEPYTAYVRQRLADDPHLWASALYDELLDLGYDRSYPTMTRAVRVRGLRPVCEPCAPTKGRPVAVIEHPPGEETQWDWVELPDPPAHWGWGKEAHLLVGALSHSGRWRGLLCESEDQAHLIEGLHHIAGALGGLTKDWRFDRMATVVSPETKRVTATFAAVAKHYGVTVRLCPLAMGTARAWSRRPTMLLRNGSGGPCLTTSASRKRRPGSIRGAPPAVTPASERRRTDGPRSRSPRNGNRWRRYRPRSPRP